jgi:hypothetical protein
VCGLERRHQSHLLVRQCRHVGIVVAKEGLDVVVVIVLLLSKGTTMPTTYASAIATSSAKDMRSTTVWYGQRKVPAFHMTIATSIDHGDGLVRRLLCHLHHRFLLFGCARRP